MKTVSVIVPVYNAEDTIVSCLGNLVHQTLDNIEILLVNDASTDGTLRILKECEAQFPDRVVLIDSDVNRGAGGARNLALDMARGEYIGFVDADDMVDTHMYEKLYAEAKKGDYDIVDCAFLDIRKDRAVCLTGYDETGILDDEKRSNLIAAQGFLCTKIIRRRLFEEPVKIRQREHAILEDLDVLTYFFAAADSISHVPEVLYKYNDRPDSASKLSDPERYWKNMYDAMKAIHDRTHMLPNYEGIREALEYTMLHIYNNGVVICDRCRDEHIPVDMDDNLRKIVLLKKNTIQLEDYEKNRYVKNNFQKKDLLRIEELDRLF